MTLLFLFLVHAALFGGFHNHQTLTVWHGLLLLSAVVTGLSRTSAKIVVQSFILLAFERKPTVNLALESKPRVNLAFESSPMVNLAFESTPTVNLAFESTPTVNLASQTDECLLWLHRSKCAHIFSENTFFMQQTFLKEILDFVPGVFYPNAKRFKTTLIFYDTDTQ